MLPSFPERKKIELSDREAVHTLLDGYVPYSDFDFVSMWAWDFTGELALSELNGNLVVMFSDYITAEPFFSFYGLSKPNETAHMLIEQARHENMTTKLQLVPEVVAKKLDTVQFHIEEDPDNHDYVLSLQDQAQWEGPEFAGKRRSVSTFVRRTANYRFDELSLRDSEIRANTHDLFKRDVLRKNKKAVLEEEHEYVAFLRVFEEDLYDELIATGVYVDDTLHSFWILGQCDEIHTISHFEKANFDLYSGIFPYMKNETAKLLHARGYVYMNLEQDLGISGLRQSKASYRPDHMLRKYTVTMKN